MFEDDDLLAGVLALAWWKHDEDKSKKPPQPAQQTAAKARWNAVVGEHLEGEP